MAASDNGDFVLVFDDLCISYSDGVTETLALPTINSNPTCIIMLETRKRFVVGYESGEMLIYGLDVSGPSIFHFHASPMIELVVKEKSLWCLHKGSIAVRIYDIDVLLTSESLSYGCIQKYQLVGVIMSLDIINSQLVAVGSSPMIQHLKDLDNWDGDIIADELDAMKIRTKHAASKMATSITGWWSRNSSADSLKTVPRAKTTLINKRLIKLTPEVTMNEPDRIINVAVASPGGKYAMVADAFNGRIFLFHVAAGLFTRLWKGYRGAQFKFLDEKTAIVLAPKQMFIELRDIIEDKRIDLIQLSEDQPETEKSDFSLLSRTILASSTPLGIQFHKLVYK